MVGASIPTRNPIKRLTPGLDVSVLSVVVVVSVVGAAGGVHGEPFCVSTPFRQNESSVSTLACVVTLLAWLTILVLPHAASDSPASKAVAVVKHLSFGHLVLVMVPPVGMCPRSIMYCSFALLESLDAHLMGSADQMSALPD